MPGILESRTHEWRQVLESKSEPSPLTAPLPTVDECHVHLKLLETITVLKSDVEAWADEEGFEQDAAWEEYLKHAVARFHVWIEDFLEPGNDAAMIPPVDVLMVWHAFMLNPGPYSRFERGFGEGGRGRGLDWAGVNSCMLSDRPRFTLRIQDIKHCPTLNLAANLLESLKLAAQTNLTVAYLQHSQHIAPIDLVDAVNRQIKFATKMTSLSWSRSPFASRSISASITRYEQFFTLISANKDIVLAPTLDIDLVWHTHQLSPKSYREFCFGKAGRFINHNDTISQGEVAISFNRAKDIFVKRFGSPYSLCLCWQCEASRHSQLSISERKQLIANTLAREISRREVNHISIDLSMAMPQCSDCGSHPATICKSSACHHLNKSNIEADCGGCSGDCGSGGCGNCSAAPIPTPQEYGSRVQADCNGGCGSCDGSCGSCGTA